MEPPVNRLEDEADRISRHLAECDFPEVARGILARTDSILRRWRARSIDALPDLERLTIREFENSIAGILRTISVAMESGDSEGVRRMITESPEHGLARFAQDFDAHTLLAEERIFRSVLILELREELQRPLTTDEAAALHELLDIMAEYSLLAMIAKRRETQENDMQAKFSGMRRLADLGTLVAGVAHDAMNILLPLRMRLEHLGHSELSDAAREDLASVNLLVHQFENSIVNLRWLSVDPSRTPVAIAPLDLNHWQGEIAEFHRRMIPSTTKVVFELPPGLPRVRISSAALSQSVFNLVHNAQQAIASCRAHGHITVAARARDDGGVDLTIEDDGPGMPREVLERCTEAFFTTRSGGSGLGLALVQTLITASGGSVAFISPAPGQAAGTMVVVTLPGADRAGDTAA